MKSRLKTVIEANRLVKTYGDRRAVDGISFHVSEGECFGLLGPNGAGKTTTFKMFYGSCRITSGELFVLGMNARENMQKIKGTIGVVPQENGLDDDFTTLENLLVYASYFGLKGSAAKSRASELLRMMQLDEYSNKNIESLSGGMKRRLVLARALLTKPKVLFLDEPTTGLDPQAREWLWNEFRDLQKKGTTLFLTTHYMEEAEELCNRLIIMNKGRAVAEGAPKDLIASYIGREVVEIEIDPAEIDPAKIGRPEVDDRIARLKEKFSYQVMHNRLKLFLRDGQTAAEALSEISSRNVIIRRASLNDVFLKISGTDLNE